MQPETPLSKKPASTVPPGGEADEPLRLRQRDERLRLIADALPVLIGFIDDKLVYRYVNRCYQDWFGVAPDRIVGKSIAEFVGQEQFERRKAYLENALTGADQRFDDVFPDVNGQPRHLAIQYIPRRRADDSVDGFYLLGMDVTDRKMLEDQMRQANVRLEGEAAFHRQELAERNEELAELARYLQSAQEDERARLARDLHDELGAIFTTAKLDLARLRAVLPDTDDARARAQHLNDNLNLGVQLKRRIIEELKPSALEHFGLAAALQNLVNDFGEASGLEITLDLVDTQFPASAGLTVYRMVQEALTNVAKYANARMVRISSVLTPEHLEIRVADDGVGFDPSQARRSAHGLRGMEFRVQAEGGTFSIHSEPGKGTVLSAILPLGKR